jgi:dTMP kinase
VPKNLPQFKLINIIGIDGAGKTTLAKALAADLRQYDPHVRYRYCQYFAKLLYPIKVAARLSVMRKTDEFKDYSHYNKAKKENSKRFPLLANIYAGIWLIDYIIQVFLKISIPVLLNQKLVVDRYIFDIAVNLSLTTNSGIAYGEKIICLFFKFAPKPDHILFIDIPEELAYGRKNDIQDVEYLKERNERYRTLCGKHGFKIIDGTKTQSQMLFEAKQLIFENNEPKKN